ncbi:MAG TPA: hypothetical protein VNO13_08245, partial [Candidatus Udaeobacter sp.]|nr:hypothetical protein [Candidatus Udaeobacter sp.]
GMFSKPGAFACSVAAARGGLAAEIETIFQAERRPRNPQVNPLRMREIPVAAFFSFFRLRHAFPRRTSKS